MRFSMRQLNLARDHHPAGVWLIENPAEAKTVYNNNIVKLSLFTENCKLNGGKKFEGF